MLRLLMLVIASLWLGTVLFLTFDVMIQWRLSGFYYASPRAETIQAIFVWTMFGGLWLSTVGAFRGLLKGTGV